MLTKILQVMVMTMFFSSLACAEQPTAAVPKGLNPGNPDVEGEDVNFEIELMSLVYQGTNIADGQPCTLFLAGFEAGGDNHSFSFLTKVETQIHEVTPVDMQAHFYRYSQQESHFYETHETLSNTTPALASLILADKTIVPDINKMVTYEEQFYNGKPLLIQSMRLDFFDFDIEAFEVGLQTVMSDNGALSSQSGLLDQMNRAILKIEHSGHHDPGLCVDFNLLGEMQPQVFKLNQDLQEEGDDHSHDHDDDQNEEDHDHDDHEGDHDDSDDHDDHDDDHGDHDHHHDHNHD